MTTELITVSTDYPGFVDTFLNSIHSVALLKTLKVKPNNKP